MTRAHYPADWLMRRSADIACLPDDPRVEVETPDYKLKMQMRRFRDDFMLVGLKVDIARDTRFDPRHDDIFEVHLVTTLSGGCTVTMPDGVQQSMAPSHLALSRPCANGEFFDFPGGQQLAFLVITMSRRNVLELFDGCLPEALRPYVEDGVAASATQAVPIEHQRLVGQARRQLLATVKSALYVGPMRSLALEGAAMQLLAASFSALCNAIPDERADLTAWEVGAARAAYEKLRADLSSPPSVAEQAADVGVTPYKLNKAFRELFGASVFETLRNLRLEQAQEALAAGELPIKEIAHRLGYRHVSNFSNAFRARFGISPREARRKH